MEKEGGQSRVSNWCPVVCGMQVIVGQELRVAAQWKSQGAGLCIQLQGHLLSYFWLACTGWEAHLPQEHCRRWQDPSGYLDVNPGERTRGCYRVRFSWGECLLSSLDAGRPAASILGSEWDKRPSSQYSMLASAWPPCFQCGTHPLASPLCFYPQVPIGSHSLEQHSLSDRNIMRVIYIWIILIKQVFKNFLSHIKT